MNVHIEIIKIVFKSTINRLSIILTRHRFHEQQIFSRQKLIVDTDPEHTVAKY